MIYYKILNENNEIVGIRCADPVLWIPIDEGNSDYQRYLQWVEEGNVADIWNPNKVNQ